MGPAPITITHEQVTLATASMIELLRARNPILFKFGEDDRLSKETYEKINSSFLRKILNTVDEAYINDYVEHYLNESLKRERIRVVSGVIHAILTGNFQKFNGMLDALQSICQKTDISPSDITVRDAITLITSFYIEKTK